MGTRFGVAQTPTHIHNGVDSPNIPPQSLTNTQTLSAQTGSVLASNPPSNMQAPVVVFPIPIVGTIPTGTAPNGTLILYYNTSTFVSSLYARVGNAWVLIGP